MHSRCRDRSGAGATTVGPAAGEEISRGQRLVGYDIPAAVARVNLQNEMNLHNLAPLDVRVAVDGELKAGLARWLTFNRLGTLVGMGYLVALPLAVHLSRPARTLVERVGLPSPPPIIALAVAISYAAFTLLVGSLVEGEPGYKLSRDGANEIKESMIAVLFACTAYAFHRSRRARAGRSAATRAQGLATPETARRS